jgi:hypothetical protein
MPINRPIPYSCVADRRYHNAFCRRRHPRRRRYLWRATGHALQQVRRIEPPHPLCYQLHQQRQPLPHRQRRRQIATPRKAPLDHRYPNPQKKRSRVRRGCPPTNTRNSYRGRVVIRKFDIENGLRDVGHHLDSFERDRVLNVSLHDLYYDLNPALRLHDRRRRLEPKFGPQIFQWKSDVWAINQMHVGNGEIRFVKERGLRRHSRLQRIGV